MEKFDNLDSLRSLILNSIIFGEKLDGAGFLEK
mgnify:CR=1 FL=1